MLKMEGLAAALVESGEREEDEEDSNMLWHWSVLNSLPASFFTANLLPLSLVRKNTFGDLPSYQRRRTLIFISSPLLMLFCYYSADCIFNFSNIFNPK